MIESAYYLRSRWGFTRNFFEPLTPASCLLSPVNWSPMAYEINESDLERQRLLQKIMEPVTDKLLNQLQLSGSLRCLDLGCGMGETTRQLAARLEKSSEVVGVDQDKELLEMAASIGPVEGCSITFQQGDAARLGFEDESFHFVFARYLLHHLSDPEKVLAEMLRVSKPGGIVAVQEPDCAKQYCHPHSWAYERIPDLYSRLFANAFVGRELYALFRQLGVAEPGLDVETIAGVNEELRRSYRMVIEAVGPALIEKGILDPGELEELVGELRRVEEQIDTLCVWSPTFSVWGVRPA